MSHLEERMEKDLNYIRNWLWKIGDSVEAALRSAKTTLILKDSKLANEVVLGDHPINRDSRQCDRLCHTFIARYLPGAGALREMASTIRVNVILERIGDYAVTICREALQLDTPLPEKFYAIWLYIKVILLVFPIVVVGNVQDTVFLHALNDGLEVFLT